MTNVVRVVKDIVAFFVTVVVGLLVGAALFMVDTAEAREVDIKQKFERHRKSSH